MRRLRLAGWADLVAITFSPAQPVGPNGRRGETTARRTGAAAETLRIWVSIEVMSEAGQTGDLIRPILRPGEAGVSTTMSSDTLSESQRRPAQTCEAHPSASIHAGMSVLILEDRPLVTMFIESCLQDAGGAVVKVATSICAARSLLNESFDAAVIDLRVADGDRQSSHRRSVRARNTGCRDNGRPRRPGTVDPDGRWFCKSPIPRPI